MERLQPMFPDRTFKFDPNAVRRLFAIYLRQLPLTIVTLLIEYIWHHAPSTAALPLRHTKRNDWTDESKEGVAQINPIPWNEPLSASCIGLFGHLVVSDGGVSCGHPDCPHDVTSPLFAIVWMHPHPKRFLVGIIFPSFLRRGVGEQSSIVVQTQPNVRYPVHVFEWMPGTDRFARGDLMIMLIHPETGDLRRFAFKEPFCLTTDRYRRGKITNFGSGDDDPWIVAADPIFWSSGKIDKFDREWLSEKKKT